MSERMRSGGRTALGMLWAGVLVLAGCASGVDQGPRQQPWRVAVLELDDGAATRQSADGVRDGMRAAGLVADRDYTLTVLDAHGDRDALAGLVHGAVRDGVDTLVALGTPALQAALGAPERPAVVFTAVADPARAGVPPGGFWRRWLPFLFSDDLPPVTGAYAAPGYADLLAAGVGVIGPDGPLGVVIPAGDPDAAAYGEALVYAAGRALRRVEIERVTAPGEVAAAVAKLCDKHVVAVVALGDPETDSAFAALSEAARKCRVPVIGVAREHAVGGAVLALTRDNTGAARAAGAMVARLAHGARVRDIDVEEVPMAGLIVNSDAADQLDIGIPLALVKRADEVLEE